MSETTEQTLEALIAVMRVGQDRAFNARRVLAAIQQGEVPGVSIAEPTDDAR